MKLTNQDKAVLAELAMIVIGLTAFAVAIYIINW